MLKRKYIPASIIIGFAILSLVVFIQAESPRRYTNIDTVEITALDWSATTYSPTADHTHDYGVALTPSFPITIPFAFSPKQQINITDAWISVTASSYETSSFAFRLDFTLNNIITIQTTQSYPARPQGLKVTSLHLNPNAIQALTKGINTLKLTTIHSMMIHKVTVIIQYEY